MLIVPGAFVKPEAYDHVADELSHRGYTVIVPALTVCGDLSNETPDSQAWKDMAEKGCLDDVKMLHSKMLPAFEEGHEMVIVGHSYGSVPACLAVEKQSVAERHARGEKGGIRAFVNLAGFAYPVRGMNLLGRDEDMPPLPIYELEAGILHIQDTAKPLLFSDLSPEKQDREWARLHKSLSHKSLLHRPEFLASEMKLPKYYVRTTKDETVVPDFQALSVLNGHFDDEFEVASGHCPMVSAPWKLAEVLDAIAKR